MRDHRRFFTVEFLLARVLSNNVRHWPTLYLTTLLGAIAAYEHNRLLEELLCSALTRLVSIVDDSDSDLVEEAVTIIKSREHDELS